MRTRLRPAWNEAELAQIYAVPHDHTCWPDHVLRVDETVKLARQLIALTGPPRVIADLSCGDAAIARHLAPHGAPACRVMLGDIAPGYEFTGPIEQTIHQVTRADLFICTETIEHLDDPDKVLRLIGHKARSLVLSTPDSEPPDANAEHYWAWDQDGVRDMLIAAGWSPVLSRAAEYRDENRWPWKYQIWGCL
jgi:hypothetical protein